MRSRNTGLNDCQIQIYSHSRTPPSNVRGVLSFIFLSIPAVDVNTTPSVFVFCFVWAELFLSLDAWFIKMAAARRDRPVSPWAAYVTYHKINPLKLFHFISTFTVHLDFKIWQKRTRNISNLVTFQISFITHESDLEEHFCIKRHSVNSVYIIFLYIVTVFIVYIL